MADTPAHLVDCVLPKVPIRQWVLTLPYPLRYRCAYDAALTGHVLRAFLRALSAGPRRRARVHWRSARGQCGAVTARVLAGTARRIATLLAARAEGDDDALARDEPLLAILAAASLRARIATGTHAGQRWRRLERLCRYVARPPLARNRFEARPDGRLALRLKTRWRDGKTHILMERHELLERLVPLIPPPRAHQVRYHGVLAPYASARDRIAPGPRLPRIGTGASPERNGAHPEGAERSYAGDAEPMAAGPALPANPAADRRARRGPRDADPREPDCCVLGSAAASGRPQKQRLPWAELLQRVFELDALRCPRCGARMCLVAAIDDPEVGRRTLACLDLPARAPPLGAAPRTSIAEAPGSQSWDPAWDFDQTPPDGYGP